MCELICECGHSDSLHVYFDDYDNEEYCQAQGCVCRHFVYSAEIGGEG